MMIHLKEVGEHKRAPFNECAHLEVGLVVLAG